MFAISLSDTRSSLLLQFVITVHLTLIKWTERLHIFGKGEANSAQIPQLSIFCMAREYFSQILNCEM